MNEIGFCCREVVMRCLVALIVGVTFLPLVQAQVKYPPRPAQYQADIRYRIRAASDERARQYRSMQALLKKHGFVPEVREDADLEPFDPTAELLTGTVPSDNASRLFEDPLIQTIVFRPAGMNLTDEPNKRVAVRIAISAGLEPTEQQQLHAQVVAQLGRLGFVQNVAYDHRNYVLVRGDLPAGRALSLTKDLRDLPTGWFLPDIPRHQLNHPLRSVLPIRAVEILQTEVAATEPGAPAPATPAAPAAAAAPGDNPAAADAPGIAPPSPKFAQELLPLLADPAFKPTIVELVLDNPLPDGEREFRGLMRLRSPRVSLEGSAGTFAIVRVTSAADLNDLARYPEVLALRLPRKATETVLPGPAKPDVGVLTATNVGHLHMKGYYGQGVRVALISTGFNAAEIGKTLPAGTKIIDLTAENSPEISPSKSADANGNALAAAFSAGAPGASLTLIRVDPTSIHQLVTVARSVLGDPEPSAALRTRTEELIRDSGDLEKRRDLVIENYRKAFSDLNDTEKSIKNRETARADYEKLKTDETNFKLRVDRLTALRKALSDLRGTAIVVNTLVWEDGYALDGLSVLSQLIDSRFTRPTTRSGIRALQLPTLPEWIQASSDSMGSIWSGPFSDRDSNSVLEFSHTHLPPDGWTPELNFLGLRGADGKDLSELPLNARIRLTIQWREPQDPSVDVTTDSLYDLSMRILRQVDPTGTTAATDDMVDVVRSTSKPVRLYRSNGSSVYEQVLDFKVPTKGRYALRIEAKQVFVPQIPAQIRHVEMNPRLFVRSLDAASTANARPILTSYAPVDVGVGMPGDASIALAIGAKFPGPRISGVGPGVQLRVKPDLLVDGVNNSGIATAYAAGVAASVASTGALPRDLIRTLGLKPGDGLLLPSIWLQTLYPNSR